jgi:Flp pilus assembly protein TadG
MRNRGRAQSGNSLIEFTLVGIPIIFVLFSTFEMARGMWLYHTLAYSVKEGCRYASVHGQNCAIPPNSCSVTIGQVARVIQSAGVGLWSSDFNLTFTDNGGTALTCAINDCLSNTTTWPPASSNTPGMTVTVSGTYPFRSMIAMFWPGASRIGPSAAVNLPAASRERIKF